jgi:predicted flavoprotein YhiN
LWLFLLEKCELPSEKIWGELGKKGLNKLVNILTNDIYQVSGRTTFRDEFVTCGGVSLQSIHPLTMESKVVKNLYFAGEILDIDAITGGFNFQAAWTTAFIAAKLK